MIRAGVVSGLLVVFASSGSARAQDDSSNKEEGKRAPAWSGSEVSLRHGYGATGVFRSTDLTWNPALVQSVSIDPRWRWNKKISFSGHIGFETELTNSDVTTRQRETLLEDTYLQGSYKLPSLPAKIGASVGLRLTLPTSKESLARETIFSIAPSFSATRDFELTDDISLSLLVQLRPSFTVATAQSLQYDAPAIPSCNAGSESCDQFNHSGTRSSFAAFNEVFALDATFPHHVTAEVLVWFVQSWLYDLSAADGVAADPGFMDGPSDTNTNFRYIDIYAIEVAWEPMKHVKISGGTQAVNPQLKPDSTSYAPFFNRYTEVFLKGTYVF